LFLFLVIIRNKNSEKNNNKYHNFNLFFLKGVSIFLALTTVNPEVQLKKNSGLSKGKERDA
jgi:hypothetical protein